MEPIHDQDGNSKPLQLLHLSQLWLRDKIQITVLLRPIIQPNHSSHNYMPIESITRKYCCDLCPWCSHRIFVLASSGQVNRFWVSATRPKSHQIEPNSIEITQGCTELTWPIDSGTWKTFRATFPRFPKFGRVSKIWASATRPNFSQNSNDADFSRYKEIVAEINHSSM